MFAAKKRVRGVMLAVALLLGSLPGAGFSWARESLAGSLGLWISADRIVGFVPFTVYVYGRMRGAEQGDLEFCRSEVAWITDSSRALSGAGGQPLPAVMGQQIGDEPPCSKGQLVRTPDGYQYKHDMHFDRPGIYHVRLMLVDTEGHRRMSNTLRVSAF
jgi:hypothetical protein